VSWTQRLALDACTDCGRCEAACPAFWAGTPLSPRNVVQKLKGLMWSEDGLEKDVFSSGVVEEDEVWACTTCHACVEACPVLIRPMDYLLEMRRALTLEGRLDKKKTTMLTNLARYGNPYGLDPSEKQRLLEELASVGVKTIQENPEAEYLYWIGCASTYDARSRSIVKSMVHILQKAGVSFAVLGMDEFCNGDPARRVGEEGRFQEMAMANAEILKKLSVRKMIVHCPHCYNTFKKEYPEFGLKLEVFHHTQIIGELLKSGRIKPAKPLKEKLTLHDSCYIGRVNGVFEEPRYALRQVAGSENFVEMGRRGVKSFCCGAGGSTYWYEVRRHDRESIIRMKEALDTSADVLVVECPYCMQMFGDAARVMGAEDKIKLKDIAEIVAESV
ncbi:MAG: (Fe-S)-binding protein, partial [Candidatus Caldarchaeum sp.]